ncbi:hypothetical protein H0H81_010497 [Sphagnurus paluster]|uniref:Uncharacterized protein n=1 Tax=Sphagnurus paluster TaxID=117069 RepID=A0A9P7FRI9_9AGAR|nr:hypothetical protein H0H81_010497 [Sphagnurus paluster]
MLTPLASVHPSSILIILKTLSTAINTMRPSLLRLVVPGLTILAWTICSACASVDARGTQVISRNQRSPQKRQIRNADYSTTPPKPIYDTTEPDRMTPNADSEPSTTPSATKPSTNNVKSKRDPLFGLGDLSFLDVVDLDLDDIPFCDELPESALDGFDEGMRRSGGDELPMVLSCSQRSGSDIVFRSRSQLKKRLEIQSTGTGIHRPIELLIPPKQLAGKLAKPTKRQASGQKTASGAESDKMAMPPALPNGDALKTAPVPKTDSLGLDKLHVARAMTKHTFPAADLPIGLSNAPNSPHPDASVGRPTIKKPNSLPLTMLRARRWTSAGDMGQ